MTREELEAELKNAYHWGYTDKGVNDYDFHSHTYRQLDDFESRKCENCKHSDLLDTDEYACSSDYMIAEFNTYPQYPLIVDSDFGCNKFKRKEDG